jgi:hypothetical protein
MLNVKMLPLNIQSKWEKEVHMGVVIEDYYWSFIYRIPFSVTKDTKLQDFQGADPGFQVRGAHLKKNCAERREARKFLGYFV